MISIKFKIIISYYFYNLIKSFKKLNEFTLLKTNLYINIKYNTINKLVILM